MTLPRLNARILRTAFMLATVAWALALPAAAYAAAGPWSTVRLAALVPYAIGSVICHQRPERSFALWLQPLPVCARCTGLYLGACAAVIAAAVGTVTVRRTRLVLTAAALPTIATLAYEWSTADVPSNIVRAGAALPLGAAIAFVVLTAADDRVN